MAAIYTRYCIYKYNDDMNAFAYITPMLDIKFVSKNYKKDSGLYII